MIEAELWEGGCDSTRQAELLLGKAEAHREMGEHLPEEMCLEGAISIMRECAQAEQGVLLAAALEKLAAVRIARGRYAEARSMLKEALAIVRREKQASGSRGKERRLYFSLDVLSRS
jgi:tetratricopeptide (TPR) repeat protein